MTTVDVSIDLLSAMKILLGGDMAGIESAATL
jgi:hypothetical protein